MNAPYIPPGKVNLYSGLCDHCDAPVPARAGTLRPQRGIRGLLLSCAECEARYVRFHTDRAAKAAAQGGCEAMADDVAETPADIRHARQEVLDEITAQRGGRTR